MNHSEIVSFLWGVADLIRDTFKRGKYQDVILPLTVLRRLDCVLAPTKQKVLGKQAELRGRKLENLDPQLRKIAGFAFYNTSRYDFEKLLADAPHVAANLRNSIAGFSPNGSPLFTGDAASGESEIRRYILENDLLEALIALPEQLFYNTGIATYVWIVTNRKARARRGRVQLIDATSFWVPMRKSLGDKRREIPLDRAGDILEILAQFKDGDTRTVLKDEKEEQVVVSRIFPTTHFGFRKITVERSLRLNFQASPERIARLEEEKGFQGLAQSKKKGAAGAREQAEGQAAQAAIRKLVRALPATLFKDRGDFERALDGATRKAGFKLPAPARKAILSALSERDDTAEICRDSTGGPEPDPELRDTESVPLAESVEAFFDREVKRHVPDAWIDTGRRDPKDGHVGLVGYEINFNRYFYRYTPPRPLEAIEADIRSIETDIVRMLAEVTRSTHS